MRLQSKILLVVTGIVALTIVTTTLMDSSRAWKTLSQEELNYHKVLLANSQQSFGLYSWNLDTEGAKASMHGLFLAPAVRKLLVLDQSNRLFTGFSSMTVKEGSTDQPQEITSAEGEGSLLKICETEKKSFETTKKVPEIQIDSSSPDGIVRLIAPLTYLNSGNLSLVGFLVLDYTTDLVKAKVRSSILWSAVRAIVRTLFLVIGILFLIRKYVIRPVEGLMISSQEIAAGNFQTEITFRSTDELGTLAKNFDQMRKKIKEFTEDLQKMVAERTSEVVAGKKKIQEILVNIQQGLLTFDTKNKIESEFSSYLSSFFQVDAKDISGKNILDFVFKNAKMSSTERDQLQQSLAMIMGEQSMSFDLNAQYLKRELTVTIGSVERTLALDWTPILKASDDTIERMLLSIRDLTEQRELEKNFKKAQDETAKLLTVISEILSVSKDQGIKALKQAKESLDQHSGSIERIEGDPNQIFRVLHTIKGNFRVTGLKGLVDSTHLLETEISKWRAGESIDQIHLKSTLEILKRHINEYNDVVQNVFSDTSKASVSLLQSVSVCLHTFTETLKKGGCDFDGIFVSDRVKNWDPKTLDVFEDILMHVLTNSADHGFCLPHQNNIPVRPARITIVAESVIGEVRLSIEDNGVGLNEAKIEAKAKQLGIKISEVNLADILFTDGFSTATSITQSSGRGVGLKAVKRISEEHKGRVTLEQVSGGGLKVIVMLKVLGNKLASAA